jgi:hypothetical protein
LGIFSELLQKGFCIPPDEKEMEGEGATSFEDAENCGIGEGEGRKDVSNQIENEEQVMVKYLSICLYISLILLNWNCNSHQISRTLI